MWGQISAYKQDFCFSLKSGCRLLSRWRWPLGLTSTQRFTLEGKTRPECRSHGGWWWIIWEWSAFAHSHAQPGPIQSWIRNRGFFRLLVTCRKDVVRSPNTPPSSEKYWATLLPGVIPSFGRCGGPSRDTGSHFQARRWASLRCFLIEWKLPGEELPVEGELCVIRDTGSDSHGEAKAAGLVALCESYICQRLATVSWRAAMPRADS